MPDQSDGIATEESMTPAATAPSNPFKVGDEVRVVKALCGVPKSAVGSVGVVVEIQSPTYIRVDCGTDSWAVSAVDLESLAPAPYIPEVGDVVEFDYCGTKSIKGILFKKGAIVAPWGNCVGMFDGKMPENVRFAGQRIESVKDHPTATAALSKLSPSFTGSYADRQKQWVEHHGLKVGSKVKVVMKSSANEGGSNCTGWDFDDYKKRMQVEVCKIDRIHKEAILISNGGANRSFPYFALEPVKE